MGVRVFDGDRPPVNPASGVRVFTDQAQPSGVSIVAPVIDFFPLASPAFPAGIRFQLLLPPDTLYESHDVGAGHYSVWADASPPAGSWDTLNWDNRPTYGYMTSKANPTQLAYQINSPVWAVTTVTPDGIKGAVNGCQTLAAPVPRVARCLVIGTTNKLALGAETVHPNPPDWTTQQTLPITAEWACFSNSDYPSNGTGTPVYLAKNNAQYVYSTDGGSTLVAAADLSGDWRDVQSVPDNGNRVIFAAVGATGGANVLKHIDLDNTFTWTADTAPVGWNPVDPRIACINFTAADATFIALSGGPGNGQVITMDVTYHGGGPATFTAWSVLGSIPNVPDVTWTTICWDYTVSNRVIIAGVNTTTGDIAFLVSGSFDITTWTQRTLLQAPF